VTQGVAYRMEEGSLLTNLKLARVHSTLIVQEQQRRPAAGRAIEREREKEN